MLYMIIEKFKEGQVKEVYSRSKEKGRLLPDGLKYLDSWVSSDLTRCFQLMQTEDPELIDDWISNWNDLVDFEVIPVLTSAEAAKRVLD
jgi:hypothetical protein